MAVLAAKELLRDGYIEKAYEVLDDIGQSTELEVKTQQEFYDELRNGVIEEVAQHIEKLTGFGQDTISSFATYIRGMKR